MTGRAMGTRSANCNREEEAVSHSWGPELADYITPVGTEQLQMKFVDNDNTHTHTHQSRGDDVTTNSPFQQGTPGWIHTQILLPHLRLKDTTFHTETAYHVDLQKVPYHTLPGSYC